MAFCYTETKSGKRTNVFKNETIAPQKIGSYYGIPWPHVSAVKGFRGKMRDG